MFVYACPLLLLLLLLAPRPCSATTLTRTFPTIELRENVPINTNVVDLRSEAAGLKLVLLNLGGFETSLFSIRNQNIITINDIDREKLLGEKRCFDRSYCLIELHVLVNDGEQYWVLPVHISDENDNKPEFKNGSIALKFHENVFGGYKILFEGARDLDEGLNGKVRYVLDCSRQSSWSSTRKSSKNESSINCYPLFQLEVVSQSLLNQHDQLALKYIPPPSNEDAENEHQLTLYAIDHGANNNELVNSMKIRIRVERTLRRPKFSRAEYEFVVRFGAQLKKGTHLASVFAESNDRRRTIYYRLANKTNFIEIDAFKGELFVSNEESLLYRTLLDAEVQLLVEASYSMGEAHSDNLKSFAKVKLTFRSVHRLNNVSFDLVVHSPFVQRAESSNLFLVDRNVPASETLLHISASPLFYPNDSLILSLDNFQGLFSLLPSSFNRFSLQTRQPLHSQPSYWLNVKAQHALTHELLVTSLTIQLVVIDPATTTSDLPRPPPSPVLCLQDSTYSLLDVSHKTPVAELRVAQTDPNVSMFSTFSRRPSDGRLIVVDECKMHVDRFDPTYSNETRFELCSPQQRCFNISSVRPTASPPLEMRLREIFPPMSTLPFRPIEIAIGAMVIVFLAALLTLLFVICRLRGFRLCTKIKNYLFYGKKYGLNNAQRLSSSRIAQRVNSIVVRESESPSSEQIKAKSLAFNISQVLEQDKIPPMNLYLPQSSPVRPISLSSVSSARRDERGASHVDSDLTPRTSSSSSFFQDTNQLLDIISLNPDSHRTTLASEV